MSDLFAKPPFLSTVGSRYSEGRQLTQTMNRTGTENDSSAWLEIKWDHSNCPQPEISVGRFTEELNAKPAWVIPASGGGRGVIVRM